MTKGERTATTLLIGASAFALPVGAGYIGVKTAGKKGVIVGALVGAIAGLAVMTWYTFSLTSSLSSET